MTSFLVSNWRVGGALVLLAFTGGCADPVDESDDGSHAGADGGAGGMGGGGSSGSADPVGFDRVFAETLVDRGCVFGCHDASSAGGLMLKPAETGAPDVEVAYAALVGPASSSPECAGWPRVVPGAPHESLLWAKMAAKLGVAGVEICGEPMPKGATEIEPEDLARVEAWIAAGAMR